MLDVDKDAIKELMEMEAVPVCDRLGSLLGRSVKMAVSRWRRQIPERLRSACLILMWSLRGAGRLTG